MYGITGNLAGGKSYNACRIMLEKLRAGEPCASNFELCPDAVTRYCGGEYWRDLYYPLHIGEYLEDEKTPHPDNDPWTWPRGSDRGTTGGTTISIFVDESAEWLDAYLPGGSGRVAGICSWLRQSSKRGQDVFLIIQHPSMMHKRARTVCHRWLWFTNMAEWRIPKVGWRLPPPWCNHFMMEPFSANLKKPEGKPQWIPKDKRIYACYKTASMFGDSARADKGKMVGRGGRPVEVDYYPFYVGAAVVCVQVISGLVGVLIR